MIGSSLLHYRISAKLGQGGMGEVYRATDTKLGRDVAIKVLPEAFATDPDRFEREAKVLASLNHSGIAHVYGFETATVDDGRKVHFLAMELVEGEELALRLKRGPIPLDEALGIARPIAEALEEAHEKGIVHRDLKPANIKITPDGKVKVLDFGLAKAYAGEAAAQPGADLSQSPTLARTGTQAGVVLGTAAYMSPEQARGTPLDKRADIWAFGVVLFEMLTGKPLFAGDTASDVLAAVLRQDLAWAALPAGTPGPVRQLLRRCLVRNPKNRLHDIADARLALEDSLAGGADEGPATSAASGTHLLRQRASWPQWLFGIALGALALATVDRTLLAPAPGSSALAETVRLEVLPPEGTLSSGPFDLAPDGRSVVFAAEDADRARALYLRALDSLEARRLPGTEGAELPFFSPDGRSVGFLANKKLQRIDLAGGPPRELASVSDPRGGTWGSSGIIVFAPKGGGPLLRIPASGGEAVPVTPLDPTKEETSHRWPQFLPDGRHFVFLSRKPRQPRLALEVGSVDGEERVRLVEADAGGRYAAGHLFFQRQTTLFAQRFETARNALRDEPKPVAEGAWLDLNTSGLAAFAVASDGRLAYRRGGIVTGRVTWLGRDGNALRTVGEAGTLAELALSPDERWIVVGSGGGESGHQPPASRRRQLDRHADCSARERRLDAALLSRRFADSFRRRPQGPIRPLRAEGVGARQGGSVLVTPRWKYPGSWSPDGRFVVYTEVDPASRANIWVLPRTGDAKPYPFLATAASETGGRFSPDGRFLAYTSDESGREEVFVQPFPATGAKWQASAAGGFDAVWRGDGRELFYVAPMPS